MGQQWDEVAAARNAFADLIESLDQAQIDRPSWCEGWTVHAVVAHVAYLSACTPVTLVREIARAKGDWNVAADRMAQRDTRWPVGTLVESQVRAIFRTLLEEPNGRFITPPQVLAGLRFEATDLDWQHGDGPLVRGPAQLLALALGGRPTLDALSGDGVDILRSRLTDA